MYRLLVRPAPQVLSRHRRRYGRRARVFESSRAGAASSQSMRIRPRRQFPLRKANLEQARRKCRLRKLRSHGQLLMSIVPGRLLKDEISKQQWTRPLQHHALRAPTRFRRQKVVATAPSNEGPSALAASVEAARQAQDTNSRRTGWCW